MKTENDPDANFVVALHVVRTNHATSDNKVGIVTILSPVLADEACVWFWIP